MTANIRRIIEIDVRQSAAAAATVRDMQRALREIEDAARRGRGALDSFFGGKIGINLASFAAVKQAISEVVDTLKTFSGVPLAMEVATIQSSLERLRLGFATVSGGGLQGAGEQISYVRKVTEEMGIEFGPAAQAFLKLSAAAKGTAVEGRGAREVFESVSAASRNLGLSTMQTGNAFKAIEQIISKGVVQQEELRGQLSEAIPGAAQIAARAYGITTREFNKMVATGTVFADEFIPKFSAQMKKEFGTDIPEGVNASTVALNKFKSSWEQLQQAFTDAGAGAAAAKQLNMFSAIFKRLTESIQEAAAENKGFWATVGATAAKFGNREAENQNTARMKYLEDRQKRLFSKPEMLGPVDSFIEESERRELNKLRMIQAQGEAAKEVARIAGREDAREKQRMEEGIENNKAGIASTMRLRQELDKLDDNYRNKPDIQKKELDLAKRAFEAGELGTQADPKGKEAQEEYARLTAAIIKKNAVVSEGQKLEEKEVENAKRMLERIREQRAVQQDLYQGDEASKEVLRNRAALEQELGKARYESAKAIFRVAEAENVLLKSDTQTAELRKAVLDTNKEIARDSEKRIEQLTKEAEQDERVAEATGKKAEKLNEAALASLAAEKAEAELSRTEAIRDKEMPGIIAHWDKLIAVLERAGTAKKKVSDKATDDEINKFFTDVEKKDTERQGEKYAKESAELRDAIVNNFRENKNIGKAIVESIQDHLEKKIFKALIEPEIDILVDTLKKGVDMFVKYLLEEWAKARTAMAASSSGAGGTGFWGALLNAIGVSSSSSTSGKTVGAQNNYGGGFDYDGAFAGPRARGGNIPMGMWATVGEQGPERAYVSAKGTMIVPSGGPTSQGSSDGGLVVNIIGAPEGTTATEKKTPNGRVLDIFIGAAKDAVASDIMSGGRVAGAMQSTYGLGRSTPRQGF